MNTVLDDKTLENKTLENKTLELQQLVMRQTDYDEQKTIEKLTEYNNDVVMIIKEYLGPSKVIKSQTNSVNQMIYNEIRTLMDDAAKMHADRILLEK